MLVEEKKVEARCQPEGELVSQKENLLSADNCQNQTAMMAWTTPWAERLHHAHLFLSISTKVSCQDLRDVAGRAG